MRLCSACESPIFASEKVWRAQPVVAELPVLLAEARELLLLFPSAMSDTVDAFRLVSTKPDQAQPCPERGVWSCRLAQRFEPTRR
jgi:hypothetical protein